MTLLNRFIKIIMNKNKFTIALLMYIRYNYQKEFNYGTKNSKFVCKIRSGSQSSSGKIDSKAIIRRT